MSQNLEMAVLQIDGNDICSTVHTISFLIYHALRLLQGIFFLVCTKEVGCVPVISS